jgi:uncharacterized LabA/DUF88 family protein
MVNSFIEIHKPVDPHLRPWMLFVDGENLTIRAQKLASDKAVNLQEGADYRKNVFVWFPGLKATPALTNTADSPIKVQDHAMRAYYYTSLTGDETQVLSVKRALRSRGFHPEVFKKIRPQEKAKGVDIALAKDFLSHAFLNNYDVAVLVAGDGDYVPLITEVKRLGKIVYVAFFRDYGLSTELHLAADMFFEMEHFFLERWRAVNVKANERETPLVQNPERENLSQFFR